ncbi:hypothetical protein Tco_0091737 [Tanacetum coccineum]
MERGMMRRLQNSGNFRCSSLLMLFPGYTGQMYILHTNRTPACISLLLPPTHQFGTTYNFGESATPTPSATTSPVVFGASSSSGSTKYSFDAGVDATSEPLTSIFGSTWDLEKSSGFVTTYNDHMSMDIMEEDCMVAEDTHVFGTGATTNNYDHMSVDSMVVEAFGQTLRGFTTVQFNSRTPNLTMEGIAGNWRLAGSCIKVNCGEATEV